MYLFLQVDNIDAKSAQIARDIQLNVNTVSVGGLPVRRPYRGIQIKDDTYAALSIWKGGQALTKLVSESARSKEIPGQDDIGVVRYYADFIIQSIEDSRQEKMQIMETFGDPYVYFYGERPRFVTFRGVLINSEDFNWRSQFWYNYEKYLRGTKLVEMGARAYLSYDSIVVEGYPISAQATDNADAPALIPFAITMLVTNYYDLSTIGNTKFPREDPVNVDVLNVDLKKERGDYVSLTSEVRRLNSLTPSGGILSTIRSGIRAVNSVATDIRNSFAAASAVLGGRNVRLPIGVAGYISSLGSPMVAGGSIGDKFNQQIFDSKTGTYKTLTGSVKLRVPGPPLYAAVPDSRLRGYKYDNLDEYPLMDDTYDPKINLRRLLSPSAYSEMKKRELARFMAATEQDIALAAWNLKAEAGGLLSGLAGGISMLKTGFGIAMSAATFAADPFGVLRASLGLGSWAPVAVKSPTSLNAVNEYERRPPTLFEPASSSTSQTPTSSSSADPDAVEAVDSLTINTPDEIRRQLKQSGLMELQEALGASYKSDTKFLERQEYIGAKAKEQNQTFAGNIVDERMRLDLFGDPNVEVDVGLVYQSSGYVAEGTLGKDEREVLWASADYEAVYGSNDYTSRAVRTAEGVEAIATIKEAYDDAYVDKPSEFTPAELESVYGTGYQSTQIRPSEDIVALLKSLGYIKVDEEIEGIRGIDDEDTEIEPVA